MPRSERANPQRRGRIQLLSILLLFLLPPVSAYVAWKYYNESGVDSTTNAGTLVSPARPLQFAGLQRPDGTPMDDTGLRGRWTYVVFAPHSCDARCEQQLYLTRQIRIAMNKDIARVQRVLVLDAAPPAEFAQRLADEHPDLVWVVAEARAEPFRQAFSGPGFAATGAQFFLVDPLGNLMMFYDKEVAAKGVMRDLQKLLKVSQIG